MNTEANKILNEIEEWSKSDRENRCAGSGSTLRAAMMLNRRAYGFEIKREFVERANEVMFTGIQKSLFV